MVEKVNGPKALYPRQGISPSELESFNGCPYRHFLSYGLNIRPRRRKLETKAKFGTLMHDLLDLCAPLFEGDFKEKLSALEKKYNIDSKETLDERLEALFKGMIATCPMELEGAEEEYMYSQFPSQFLNTLKILLFHMDSGEFRMAFHEEKFSYEVNGVNYSGRIDRADVYKNYLKIIDYKSSNKSLDIAMALEGFNVQMALYLEMLSKNKQLDKGALLYFNTSRRKLSDDGKMYLDGKTAEDFEKEYQMEGWILEEDKHEVMYGIDHNFPESRIAHIKYVKSRDAYSGRLMRKDVLDRFIQEIFNHLHVLVERCFVEGDISIQPAGSDDLGTHMKVNPCQYCDYQDVCMRDPFYHEDRPIKLLEKEEMNQILEGGKQDGESHIDE
jgi:ATP-dependent helicase/DNAse subunit B